MVTFSMFLGRPESKGSKNQGKSTENKINTATVRGCFIHYCIN